MRIVTVPDNLALKLQSNNDLSGIKFRDLDVFATEWNQNFEFKLVGYKKLSESEKEVFNHKDTILNCFPHQRKAVKIIVISETMRLDDYSRDDVLGLWEPANKCIIIKRSQLSNVQTFTGTLLHELVYAFTGTDDMTIEFENELMIMLGRLAADNIDSRIKSKNVIRKLFRLDFI